MVNRLLLRGLIAAVGLNVGLAFGSASAADLASSLADAARQHDRAAVKRLLKQDVDLDSPGPDSMTPLHWAVYHDDTELTQSLIAAGADVNVNNRYGVPPLSIACTNGNADIVGDLLQAGADPNAALPGGETALMTAARTGKPEPVKILLVHGADVDATERNRQTALMWAAAAGNASVVDALIQAGADFTTALDSGFTPFFFAVREGHIEVVLTLLKAGIDVNDTIKPSRRSGNGPQQGTSGLMLAVENGHFELALALLDAGANANDDRLGYTALHALTWVRKPLRGDGDPPPIGSGSLSSLDFARHWVSHGGDVNARHGKHRSGNHRLSYTQATPLLLAANTGDLPLIELLVDLGADPSLTNADNCTPLLAASGVDALGSGDESAGTEDEAIAVVKYLLDRGADINAVDDTGKTAMHGAAFQGWTKLVAFLADNGADVNTWNRKLNSGWTPLMIAEGHRPGNFRPSAETIKAIEKAMRDAGVEPPQPAARKPRNR